VSEQYKDKESLFAQIILFKLLHYHISNDRRGILVQFIVLRTTKQWWILAYNMQRLISNARDLNQRSQALLFAWNTTVNLSRHFGIVM